MLTETFVDYQMSVICKKIGNDTELLSAYLNSFGFATRASRDYVRMNCFMCKSTDSIGIKVNGRKEEEKIRWACFSCSCQKKKFDNLAGLIRTVEECSPYIAANKLFDVVFKTARKTDITCPLEPHKGKTLDQVPPHFIFYCCHGASANISPVLKTKMLAYLFDESFEVDSLGQIQF